MIRSIAFPEFIMRFLLLLSITVAAYASDNEVRLEAMVVETLIDNLDSGTGGLAIDKAGNVFSADFGWRLDGKGKGGNKVFRVTPDGKSTLFCRDMRGASGNTFDRDGNLFQSSYWWWLRQQDHA